MKKLLTALLLLTSSALGIEEPIYTDTTHPRAVLAPLSGIQGFSKDLRVYVSQAGQPYSGMTNGTALVVYYATNLASLYVGSATNISINTNNSSALIRTAALPPGNMQYAVAIIEGGRTNDLGTGLLTVKPSTFAGQFSPLPGITIDWSGLTWTGSNQPLKSGSATIDGVPFTNGSVIVTGGGGTSNGLAKIIFQGVTNLNVGGTVTLPPITIANIGGVSTNLFYPITFLQTNFGTTNALIFRNAAAGTNYSTRLMFP